LQGAAHAREQHQGHHGAHRSPPISRDPSTAVSSGDNEEVTYRHIEKTVICAIAWSAIGLSFRSLTCYLQTAGRVHDVTAALAPWRERKPYNPPLLGARADAERIGEEEPWHELRSKIVSSV
jgi:hypothetical protein